MRVAPASSMASASASVRIPPEALTPSAAPTAARIKRTSSTVAPPLPNPGRLHELRTGRHRQTARPALLVIRQEAGLQDHLHERAARGRDHRADAGLDIALAPGLQRAHREHHVHLGRALLHGQSRFGGLDATRVRTEPEPDHGASLDGRTGEALDHERDGGGVDADRREPVIAGLATEAADLVVGRVRLQERVIDAPPGGCGSMQSSRYRILDPLCSLNMLFRSSGTVIH